MFIVRNRTLQILTLATLVGGIPLAADSVILRNGQTLQGTVFRQNRTTLYLRTDKGVQTVPKATIRRVLYGAAAKAAEAKKRLEAEQRARAVERQKRVDEERRRAEAARLTREEAEKARKEEEVRKRAEAARLQKEEAERQRVEAENARKAEAERVRKEEAARALAKEESAKKAQKKSNKTAETKAEKKGEAKEAADAKSAKDRGKATPEKAAISPLRALGYSAMVPGLGQWKSGRRAAAGAYGALFVGGAALVYDNGRLYRNALRDYGELNNPFSESGLVSAALGSPRVPSAAVLANPAAQAAYSNTFEDQRAAADRQYANYRKAGIFLGAVYALNLADSYLAHPDVLGRGAVTTDRKGALLWSAAFPGLGQWRSGRRGEGILYGFLFSAAAFAAYDSRREYLNAKRVYEQSGNPYETGTLTASLITGRSVVPGPLELQDPVTAVAYDLQFSEARSYMDRKYRVHRMALISAGILYIWAAADAFLFHPGSDSQSALAGPAEARKGLAFDSFRMAVVPAVTAAGSRGAEGELAAEFRF